ncbi:MAG: hypothetical protein M1826_005758 [Phylliscum demangeonii]|nr:MAG: hypothetical protein M1826_005758 [Phylliscum demangeonii]
MNTGFQTASDQTLYTWGQTLMSTSFGAAPWLRTCLTNTGAWRVLCAECGLDNTFVAPTSYLLIVLLRLYAYGRLQSRATQPGHGARCRDANAIWTSTGDETVIRWRPAARRAPANHRDT